MKCVKSKEKLQADNGVFHPASPRLNLSHAVCSSSFLISTYIKVAFSFKILEVYFVILSFQKMNIIILQKTMEHDKACITGPFMHFSLALCLTMLQRLALMAQ